jgi:hypothetical protein
VIFVIAETTTTGLRARECLTTEATWEMASAFPTDVPPNFITIIAGSSSGQFVARVVVSTPIPAAMEHIRFLNFRSTTHLASTFDEGTYLYNIEA